MDILDEARTIADQYGLEKPDQVTDNDWLEASPDTKSLLVQVEELKKPLEDIYREAVSRGDWRRAFFTFQGLIYTPYLHSINRGVWDEKECIERETEFITRAKEWLVTVRELLNGARGF